MANCTSKSGLHPKGGDKTCPACKQKGNQGKPTMKPWKMPKLYIEEDDSSWPTADEEEAFWAKDDLPDEKEPSYDEVPPAGGISGTCLYCGNHWGSDPTASYCPCSQGYYK